MNLDNITENALRSYLKNKEAKNFQIRKSVYHCRTSVFNFLAQKRNSAFEADMEFKRLASNPRIKWGLTGEFSTPKSFSRRCSLYLEEHLSVIRYKFSSQQSNQNV